MDDTESPLRRMMADSGGTEYKPVRSLQEARVLPDSFVIFEGDYGGQIYLVARVQKIKCTEAVLTQLLADIDALEWDDPEGAQLYFAVQSSGQFVPGGMGGGIVSRDIWIHPRLVAMGRAKSIVQVLSGTKQRIAPGKN